MTTLTEFILEEERKFKNARGNFTLLLTQLENAAKIIASHVRQNGLVDMLGSTGKKNAYNDDVQKLDVFSNDLLVSTLTKSGQVYALASEELEKEVYINEHPGEYVVFFDPLDGSSNIDTSITIGTIFSIYHKSDTLLQPGNKQVAAGYIAYGTNVMFVYTSGQGVNGFTFDPSIGSFILTHPHMKIPDEGKIYSINEGSFEQYEEGVKNYLNSIKKQGDYKGRYVGSMIADIHRTLLKGGIFLLPTRSGKATLRLMFEVNPLSFVVEQAGGAVTTGNENPLSIQPSSLTHKVPAVLGSKKNVEEFLKYAVKQSTVKV